MSNLVLPAGLPGLSWDVKKRPMFNTKVMPALSGKEVRTRMMLYPTWQYEMSYTVLREIAAQSELQKVVGFFLVHGGRFDSFLHTDPNDNAVTDQQFGIGNASQTQFQLVRTYGAGGFVFDEPVQNPNVVTNVKVNGVTKTLTTDYTIGSTGIITFVAAPGAALPVTWTGTYYWRVRFDMDVLEFNNFMYQLWELKKLQLQTIKQ